MSQPGKGRVLEGNQSPWRYWLYSLFCAEIPTGRTERAPEPLPETFCGVSEIRQNNKETAIMHKHQFTTRLKGLGIIEVPTGMDFVFLAVLENCPN